MAINYTTEELAELAELKDYQISLLENLVEKIEGWRSANGIPDTIIDPLDTTKTKKYVLSKEEAYQFTKWLQDTISSETNFLPKKGTKLILYSGNAPSGTPLWKELQQFHFRLTIATFRKPVLNIFSSYRRKSLDKKEIKHIRGTSFPLA